jgi:shikimate dehydrogenase
MPSSVSRSGTPSPRRSTRVRPRDRTGLTYEAIEAPVGGFVEAVDRFRAAGGRGCNVTQPFKLDAFAYSTEQAERARLAGAVNCMKFDGDRVLAENFDGIALISDIERNLGYGFAASAC